MSSIILPRRKFLTGFAAFLAAPAIVRASSLMPISVAREGNAIVTADEIAKEALLLLQDGFYKAAARHFFTVSEYAALHGEAAIKISWSDGSEALEAKFIRPNQFRIGQGKNFPASS